MENRTHVGAPAADRRAAHDGDERGREESLKRPVVRSVGLGSFGEGGGVVDRPGEDG